MTTSVDLARVARRLAVLPLLLATLAAAPARAAGDDALFQALGGRAGIAAIVAGFVPRLTADPRTAPFFEKTDLAHLKESLAAQFCEVSGGPCTYEGPSMEVAHRDFEISRAHFNALVEDLQAAMDERGVPFAVQNRLLARLAPMHRDVVTVR